MDKYLFVPTALIGLVVVVMYAYLCHRHDRHFDIGTMVSLLLFSAGIVGSFFIVASTFIPNLRNSLSELNLYILIAGAVVFAHSVQGIAKELKTKPRGQG
jgi:uncharacterized membrane protein YdcZ (DUF606 family)